MSWPWAKSGANQTAFHACGRGVAEKLSGSSKQNVEFPLLLGLYRQALPMAPAVGSGCWSRSPELETAIPNLDACSSSHTQLQDPLAMAHGRVSASLEIPHLFGISRPHFCHSSATPLPLYGGAEMVLEWRRSGLEIPNNRGISRYRLCCKFGTIQTRVG